MKRLLTLTLTIICLLTAPAYAIILDDTNAHWMTGVHTDGINNDAYDQAEMLKQLGLFMGTPNGFELERNMTRAEAAVMLVRFLGAEEKVRAGNWAHPFHDVPAWVDKYVGWLYQSGLTKGISSSQYGAQKNTTLEQYAIFLSRAVSGNDDWQGNGIASAEEVKLWDEDNRFFSRGAAVGLSTRALSLTYTKNDNWTYSMAQYLIDKGVFSVQDLLQAAWEVLPPVYKYLDDEDRLYNTIAGVAVAKTDMGGLVHLSATDSSLPYFYASRQEGQYTQLYQIDCKSMESNLISSRVLPSGDSWAYTYAGSISGRDYLFEHSYSQNRINLLQYREGQLLTLLSDFKFQNDEVHPSWNVNYFIAEGSILIAGKDQYYLLDQKGLNSHTYPEGTQVLGFDGISLLTQQLNPEDIIIDCIQAADGSTLDSYSVKQDTAQEYFYRSLDYSQATYNGKLFYGEAGLYLLEAESHRLKQITALPTLDLTTLRNDQRYIILTHDPGQRLPGFNRNGGDQIVIIEYDDSERVLLDNNPAHGIAIAGFLNYGMGSAVAFYSAADVGMQHFNVYHYILLPSFDQATGSYDEKQPQIVVDSYTAGRPEMESPGYEQSYMEKEQARLNALGYGNQ
ncbi:MAG: S-layer homology domain-containing protein [Syntrophomonadaceae bacterium]|jgi:hypothetical protein|nr:S-layer homology domain-containing protein [Syntrophomonadaceae bacterium]